MATELRDLIKRRGVIKGNVKRFQNYIVKKSEAAPSTEIQARLDSHVKQIFEFESLQLEIECLSAINDEDETEREDFENSYYKALADAKQILNEREAASIEHAPTEMSIPNTSNVNDVRLPVINLPEFDGSYENWYKFRDAFNTLVNYNGSLSNVQKFMYLTLALKGSAAEVIQSLEVSGDNYYVALELIKERFENKKLIVNTHVRALFELEGISRENSTALRQLLDKFLRHTRALEAVKLPINEWDTLLIYMLSNKLDNNTRKLWELSSPGPQLPKLADLIKFLKDRCQALETLSFSNNPSTRNIHVNDKPKRAITNVASRGSNCLYCKGQHSIYYCKDFLNKNSDERLQSIKDKRACTNCLVGGHTTQQCKSKHNCFKCRKRHHTLLHTNNIEGDEHNTTTTAISLNQSAHVFLSTAIVFVKTKNNSVLKARALIDSGSDSNYITTHLFSNLNLTPHNNKRPTQIIEINGTVSQVSKYTQATIVSLDNKYEYNLNFLVIDKITERIPVTALNTNCLKLPSNINLADPTYNKPTEIDLLIGAEIFYDLIQNGKIELGKNKPVLRETKLGWLVTGRLCTAVNENVVCNLAIQNQRDLSDDLERFWKLDDCPDVDVLSTEDKICEQHFIETTVRNNDGRYVVSLPFNENKDKIGETLNNTIFRFLKTEKRLQREPELKNEYVNFMNEYENLGHMEKITELTSNYSDLSNNHGMEYYIPHHAVVKETSSTTKVRIVFDASAQSSSGYSLNNTLYSGPTIQSELLAMLIRFRKHNVVITADIEKMFRQVLVSENDRDYQKIVWRNDPSQNLNIYRLRTVTYGTAPATFLTTRCLKDVALRFKDTYPEAVNAILNDTYVDDVITGCQSAKAAIKLKNELTHILNSGCFNLRKWCSNSTAVLESCLQTGEGVKHLIKEKTDNRTLGVIWVSEDDTLRFISTTTVNNAVVTKRTILATIAKIFDPLGLLAPIVVRAKILLQNLWLLKLEWDDCVPDDIQSTWFQLIEDIKLLHELKIPRKIITNDPVQIDLCGFCDSSEAAYGAAIYVRSLDKSGNTTIALLCSKSRVAPVKKLSIPRLELSGALLLAKLTNNVTKYLQISITNTYFFTDSTIVINWINGQPGKWKTFVANRVSKIQALCNIQDWHHVDSKNNPADVVSRGSDVPKLKNSIWWTGPNFLQDSKATWPSKFTINHNETLEGKINKQTTLIAMSQINLINRYSSFEKLKRMTAYLLRFSRNCSIKAENRNLRKIGPLTVDEIINATNTLLRVAQHEAFAKELQKIRAKENIPKTSNLACLSPFLDTDELLRVGGRLHQADLDFDKRHQIILPKGHSLTKLIIRYYHNKHFHAGLQATLSAIRENYWPINGKNAVKGTLRACIVCFKYAPRHVSLKMADLPKSRLTPTRAFLYTSLDMAGPFLTKESKFRNKRVVKSYVCVFVCFVTKAIHLEIVSDLTTPNFLNCLKRFVARRGLPTQIYSDNAKTFVAANKELRMAHNEMINYLKEESVNIFLLENNVTWKFMPPRAPHFGGLHEAAVKSMKTHLKKVISDRIQTIEDLSTLLCQVEAILNSRPLYPCSADPKDLTALTPGHFIIGCPLTAVPQANLCEIPTKRLKIFEQLQQQVQHFWQRWLRDYLSNLQPRQKWRRDSTIQPKVGDLVLVQENNVPPQHWPLGRISTLHPGADGKNRVATVHMRGGEVIRSTMQLCPLPEPEDVEILNFNAGEYVQANVPNASPPQN